MTPQREDGTLIEPLVSVARETGIMPDATATAEPQLEPPDNLEVFHGFLDDP